MSDPLKNLEIEDVLSSIRRLVTEESRPNAAKSGSAKSTMRDRLVLSPALRVPDTDADETPSEPAADDAASGATDHDDTLYAQVSDDPDKDRTDAPWNAPDATLFETASAMDGVSDRNAAGPSHDPAEPGEPMGTSQVHHGDDADIARADDDALAPETTVDDPTMRPVLRSVLRSVSGDDDAGSPSRAASLSEKIEALEAAIAETDDQWEPDGDSADDYSGTAIETLTWEDHDEDGFAETAQRMHGSPTGSVDLAGPESDDESPDFMGADEAVLDEETLRELVADIVRQELQGALGERITRNVRKLVRREIHRALTVQEFD